MSEPVYRIEQFERGWLIASQVRPDVYLPIIINKRWAVYETEEKAQAALDAELEEWRSIPRPAQGRSRDWDAKRTQASTKGRS